MSIDQHAALPGPGINPSPSRRFPTSPPLPAHLTVRAPARTGAAVRRLAAAAAYSGGGLGVLGGAVAGLVFTQMRIAKRHVGGRHEKPPAADGLYGAAFTGNTEPLRLALLGDSTAAGQGVHRPRQTPGAQLASALAAVADRPVVLRNVSRPGARSNDLPRQVRLLTGDEGDPHAPPAADVAVVIIGANDVTRRMPVEESVRYLAQAVARLREAGSHVVVATCPDLGSVETVDPPLRWIARWASRRLATAQTIAAVNRGARTVSLADLLGPQFQENPRELFGPDNYHPSAEGYAAAALALLPTVCAALGEWPAEHPALRTPHAPAELVPLTQAATHAVAEGGTEVLPARGRQALLRRRIVRPPTAVIRRRVPARQGRAQLR